jgi:hypothetical protein
MTFWLNEGNVKQKKYAHNNTFSDFCKRLLQSHKKAGIDKCSFLNNIRIMRTNE